MARVTVVIPTHERETRLAFALDALAKQTLPRDEFEVIVVRSPAPQPPLAQAPPGLDARFLESDEAGPGPQRNAGWRAARSELIAFIDDDCRPEAGWLEGLLAASAPGDLIVQGQTEPDPSEAHLLFGLARTVEIKEPSGLYETCNLLYPRALLERLGGFAGEFRLPHWGEDTDLGLRAEAAGARLEYAPTARVWHSVHPNPLPRAIREAGRRRRFALLVARHPRLRDSMPAGLFVNEAHAGIAIAAAGVLAGAVARRRRGAILAAGFAPYVLRLAREFAASREGISARRIARLALHLPARASVDFAETVATVRGAVEARTPVI